MAGIHGQHPAGERVFGKWEPRPPGPQGSSHAFAGCYQPHLRAKLPVAGWQAVPGRCQPSAPLPGITCLNDHSPSSCSKAQNVGGFFAPIKKQPLGLLAATEQLRPVTARGQGQGLLWGWLQSPGEVRKGPAMHDPRLRPLAMSVCPSIHPPIWPGLNPASHARVCVSPAPFLPAWLPSHSSAGALIPVTYLSSQLSLNCFGSPSEASWQGREVLAYK